MKIAIVADVVYPYSIGGTEKRIYEISTRLVKKGHQVTIYCMKWWKGPATRVEGGVQLKAISPYFPLYVSERRSIKEALFFSLHCFKLIKEDFDILDVDHMPHVALFSTKLVALLKKKTLYAIWNEVWGIAYWIQYMGPAGIIAAWVEKVAARLPDKLVAVSDHTASALMTELNVPLHKIAVIPNGISLAELKAVNPATPRSDVIFVGRLLAHKNVALLVKCIALLKATHPRIRCLIVGRGPEKDNLLKLTRENGLQENIVFIDAVEDHTQLYALMKASRVFVLPSTREGFGIVVLEANACGLPVITINHPHNAARHLIKEGVNGRTVTLSAENLAQAIDQYITIEQKILAHVSWLQHYDWDYLTQKVEDMYVTQQDMKPVANTRSMPLKADGDEQAIGAREKVFVKSSALVKKKLKEDEGR